MDTQAYLLIGLLIAVRVLGPFLLRVLFNKTGDVVVNKYRESTNNAVNQANAAAGPQRLADRYPGFLESMGLASAAAAAQAAAPAYVSPTTQPPAPPLSSLNKKKAPDPANQETMPLYAPAPAEVPKPVAAPKPAEAPKPVQEPQTIFCMYCGKQIASGAAFCPYCGKKQA